MRSVMGCLGLVLVLLSEYPGSDALAEPMPVIEEPSMLSVSNHGNKDTDQRPVDPGAAVYARTVAANAGVSPDAGVAKQAHLPQGSPAAQPKSSFWQWLSGKTMDCSSGVCVVR